MFVCKMLCKWVHSLFILGGVFFFEQCSIIAEEVVCYGWFLDTELASEKVWLNRALFIVFVEEDVKLEPTIPTLTPSALTHSVHSFCFLAHQTFVFRSLVDGSWILSIVCLCAKVFEMLCYKMSESVWKKIFDKPKISHLHFN